MAAALWVVAVATGGTMAPAEADTIPPRPDDRTLQRVADYLDQQVAERGWPGAELAIVQGQSVLALHGVGKADDHGRALTAETPILLGSVTKSVTAVAVMQLVEEGRLRLDAPVVTYLPWFRTRDRAVSDTITVADLLHHSSGLGTNLGGEDRVWHSEPAELERGVRGLAEADLMATPSTRFIYSNANYNVLGMIVEAVSGQSYGAHVEQRIFRPAGMSHSFIGKDQADGHRAAVGYRPWFGGPYRPTDTPVRGVFAPSAGGYSSAADLARYLIMQMNDGTIDGKRLLTPASVALMHQPVVAENDFTGYGMGWRVRPGWEYLRPTAQTPDNHLPLLLDHAGSWPNTATYAGFLPEAKLGLVVLVNASAPDQAPFSALGPNIWRLLAGQEPTAVAPPGRWLELHGWHVGLGILVALLASLALSLLTLLRRRRSPLRWLSALLAFDAVVLLFAFSYLPRTFDSPVLTIGLLNPDIGLELVAVTALTVVWGPVRTLLLLSRAVSDRRAASPRRASPTS